MRSYLRRSSLIFAASATGAVAIGLPAVQAAAAHPTAQAAASRVTVLAAASLTKVFPSIDPRPRFTFGGSGMLEKQIQQGAPADVFAAASPKQTTQLYNAGLVYKPIEFTTNTLVMIVPRDNPGHIRSVNDITRRGIKIVVCNSTVPCGDYATAAFANLGISAAAGRNIVSQQTDVTQVVAQISAGQGDVGFAYITDAKASNGKVKAISLPAKAKPYALYQIAIVKATKNRLAARAFIKEIMSKRGQGLLRAAGFGKR